MWIYITTLWNETNIFSLISQPFPTESVYFLQPRKEGKDVRKIRGIAEHRKPASAAYKEHISQPKPLELWNGLCHWLGNYQDGQEKSSAKCTEKQYRRALGLAPQMELKVSQIIQISMEQSTWVEIEAFHVYWNDNVKLQFFVANTTATLPLTQPVYKVCNSGVLVCSLTLTGNTFFAVLAGQTANHIPQRSSAHFPSSLHKPAKRLRFPNTKGELR